MKKIWSNPDCKFNRMNDTTDVFASPELGNPITWDTTEKIQNNKTVYLVDATGKTNGQTVLTTKGNNTCAYYKRVGDIHYCYQFEVR